MKCSAESFKNSIYLQGMYHVSLSLTAVKSTVKISRFVKGEPCKCEINTPSSIRDFNVAAGDNVHDVQNGGKCW